MINDLLKSINKIYIAYGATDFRKQTESLCNIIVDLLFKPYKNIQIFSN